MSSWLNLELVLSVYDQSSRSQIDSIGWVVASIAKSFIAGVKFARSDGVGFSVFAKAQHYRFVNLNFAYA